jgi:hypothetical protein
VLQASDPSRLYPHSVEGLGEAPSLVLFRTHSAMDPPPAGLEGLERDIVKRCSGVPLALKIAGSSVQGHKRKVLWEVPMWLLCLMCILHRHRISLRSLFAKAC